MIAGESSTAAPTPAPTTPGNGEGEANRPPVTPSPPPVEDSEPETVSMPHVVDRLRDDAVSELESLGLSVWVRYESAWNGWWRGRVQRQSPESGGQLQEGDRVTIWVGN
jgi:hypothetical protein